MADKSSFETCFLPACFSLSELLSTQRRTSICAIVAKRSCQLGFRWRTNKRGAGELCGSTPAGQVEGARRMRGSSPVGLMLQFQSTGDNSAHCGSFGWAGGFPIDAEALTADGAFHVLFCVRSHQQNLHGGVTPGMSNPVSNCAANIEVKRSGTTFRHAIRRKGHAGGQKHHRLPKRTTGADCLRSRLVRGE